MSALSPSPLFSISNSLADTRLSNLLWAMPPFDTASAPVNGTDAHVITLYINNGASSSSSSSSRFVVLARLAPLLAIALLAAIHALRRASSRRTTSRAKTSSAGPSRQSIFDYFAPFVTEQDVLQHRLESLRHTRDDIGEQPLDQPQNGPSSSMTSDHPHSVQRASRGNANASIN